MGIFSSIEYNCGVCVVPPVQIAPPNPCDTKLIGVDRVIVGFLNCEASNTSTPPIGVLAGSPTLLELQALITADKLSVIGVNAFTEGETAWEKYALDAFSGDSPIAASKQFMWEYNFWNLATKDDKLFWDDKLKNRSKLHFITIEKNDVVTFYRTPMNDFVAKESYDANARTNVKKRAFELNLKWADDTAKTKDWYVVAGAYTAFGDWK